MSDDIWIAIGWMFQGAGSMFLLLSLGSSKHHSNSPAQKKAVKQMGLIGFVILSLIGTVLLWLS